MNTQVFHRDILLSLRRLSPQNADVHAPLRSTTVDVDLYRGYRRALNNKNNDWDHYITATLDTGIFIISIMIYSVGAETPGLLWT